MLNKQQALNNIQNQTKQAKQHHHTTKQPA